MTNNATSIVGTSPPIREALEKATGRARFVDDLPADYHVKVLGSPHPHALITRIDINQAAQLEGVSAILTHEDVGSNLLQFGCHRPTPTMDKQLRYVGDYVAAVAATSEAIAEQALNLIEVEYEMLPAVFDPEEALQDGAPLLYPEGNAYANATGTTLENRKERSVQAWGDIDKGFADADVIVEDSYDIKPQMHAALETHVCMAQWHEREVTIWNSTQVPWELRLLVSDYFKIAESSVVVLSPNVGGGFGGKYTGRYQFIVCLLAKKLKGKRVKMNFTREESLLHVRRPRGKIYTRIGARKDGTITALHLKGYFDIGAYGNFRGGSNSFHLEGGILSYKTDNAWFEAHDVHTNHSRADCMRAVQVPFLSFAIESTVEQLAEKLEMDPVAFRILNMPESGDMMPPTEYTENDDFFPTARFDLYPGRELMEKVLDKIGWKEKWNGFSQPSSVNGPIRRGIGMAYAMGYAGFYSDGSTKAEVVMNVDGSVTVYSGAQEIGQGINTGICMLAAESLGLPLKDVYLVTGDTRSGQYDVINARSSHQLATGGHILLMAIEKVKKQLREMAAPWLGIEPDSVVIRNKTVFVKDQPETAMEIRDLIGSLGSPISASASGPPGSLYPEVKPGYKAKQPMVMAAEVDVDMETGVVTPVRVVTGMFPGRMINKKVVRGQALGGAVQTLGMALWEHFQFDREQSRYLSKDFTDYRLPRARDIPEIETVLLEQVDEESLPHEGLPYGGRGVGEMTAWGAIAIANAVENAIGVRIRTSPLTAEIVLNAIEEESTK